MKEVQDYYFRKAKAENYPARSVYKLKEIDAKFRLLKSGFHVLDLGAAPGSWSLLAAEKIGSHGKILAVDMQAATASFTPNITFSQADIFNPTSHFQALLTGMGPFDIILSDMAPATTGSVFTDQARSYHLASRAFELALEYLKNNGSFVVKIFMGPDVKALENAMRGHFRNVKSFKPKSSRAESKETFLIGMNFSSADRS